MHPEGRREWDRGGRSHRRQDQGNGPVPTFEDVHQASADTAQRLAAAHLDAVEAAVDDLAAGFPRHVEREDLFGAGCAGLMEAARRYDPTLGVPFVGYATRRIRGSIIDATRNRDWATRRLRRDLRAVAHATEVLTGELARHPTERELTERLGIAADQLAALRLDATNSTLLALDQPIGPAETEVTSLGDVLAEHDPAWLPELALEVGEQLGLLRRAIAHLPHVLRYVVREHHLHGRLLVDISTDLDLTEARVSQLRIEGLHALQAYFATRFDGVPPVPPEAPGKRRRADYVARMAALDRRPRTAPPPAGDPAVTCTSAPAVV